VQSSLPLVERFVHGLFGPSAQFTTLRDPSVFAALDSPASLSMKEAMISRKISSSLAFYQGTIKVLNSRDVVAQRCKLRGRAK
jgi:hypothetical protein